MTIETLNIFITVLVVGSLTLLAFLFIANPLKVNRKANLFFGIFTLLWATFWTEEIFIITHTPLASDDFWLILKFVQFFAAIFFYFGVSSFTSPHRKLRPSDLVHLILPFIYLVVFIFQQKDSQHIFIEKMWIVMIVAQSLSYTVILYFQLIRHENKIELISSNKEEIDLKWIKQVIISLVAISIFFIVYSALVSSKTLNIVGNTFLYLNVLFIGYHMMKQKEIFLMSKDQIEEIFSENKPLQSKQKLIADSDLPLLIQELIELMEKQKPYLEKDLSLQKLSKIIKLSPHQLSYLLNEGLEENFFQFVNRYRVEMAKDLLLNKAYDHLSIIGIAYEAGFNSKTAFNTFFKKTTSKTPSEFKKSGSLL